MFEDAQWLMLKRVKIAKKVGICGKCGQNLFIFGYFKAKASYCSISFS